MTDFEKAAAKIADERCRKMAEMEDRLAMEIFGCQYDDLDYDDRDYITCEMYDRFTDEIA